VGGPATWSSLLTVTIVTTQGDLVGAGLTTPSLFRRAASGNALWLAQGAISTNGWTFSGVPPTSSQTFGSLVSSSTLDIPFTGDFDGDGITDIAVYTPSTNTWDIKRSLLPELIFKQGKAGDIPVVGDFDGDGITDVGVYTPTTGVWTVSESTVGTVTLGPIGGAYTLLASDIPVPGNYDNTGKAELAVYRAAANAFYINGPTGVYARVLSTGTAGDVPVPGDYNNSLTSRATEAAVFNPTTGAWVIAGPTGVLTTVSPAFKAGDIPAPGDYLGTGSLQPAVYRPSTGKFYVDSLTSGGAQTVVATLGTAGDIPLTAPLVYRSLISQPTLALAASSDTGIPGDNMTSGRRDSSGVRWIDLTGTADPGVTVQVINLSGNTVIATTTSNATGTFTASISGLTNGTYNLRAQAVGLGGTTSAPSTTLPLTLITVAGDYTGTGKTSQALFNRVSTKIGWTILGLNSNASQPYGSSTLFVPLSGDLNGDGKTDLFVYAPSAAQWYVQGTSAPIATFGWSGVDIPAPADYNGDGITDIAAYRPKIGSTTDGYWYLSLSGKSGGIVAPPITTPLAGDVPVPGDYENVGHAEVAIFRPSAGLWFVKDATNPSSILHTFTLGTSGDIPVPGAYDATATNHAIEPAVFRPSTGQWFVRTPTGTQRVYQFKVGDIPAPGDYNGDGITDPVVYRPSTKQWLTYLPGATSASVLAPPYGTGTFGTTSDTAVNSPYHYRQLTGSGGTVSILGIAANTGSSTSSSSAALDLGSSARNLANGTTSTLTPAPAATPTKVNIHTRARRVKVPAKVAIHARQATVVQNAATKKTTGQLF
jgi:hypothetical protein